VRDLIVITPSRGRPDRLRDMLDAATGLMQARTLIVAATDTDDPHADAYRKALEPFMGNFLGTDWVHRITGSRRTLSGWTNAVAALYAGKTRAFASFGDDHLPRTPGWDRLLLEAISRMGGTGIAYGDDTIMGERLPTAPVISADIVDALGWMALPSCRHMCIDLAWKDLGLGADCLAYVPEVTIEHRHWGVGKSALDETYAEAEARHQDDRDAHAAWQADEKGMAADIRKIRALREKAA
jgi:hypothetical protein